MSGWVFLGWTSIKQGLMCLDQGHNTVTSVRLESATPQSQDKHSTTEPLRPRTAECKFNVLHMAGMSFDR